jgi:hypothetical protein
MRRLLLLLAACSCVAVAQAAPLRHEVLDDFHDASAWQASASDQVRAALRRDRDGSLCLDYDFAGVSGYAVMRRALPVDWPSSFDLSARLKGGGATNDFQFKLVDASGDNVWWMNRPNHALPTPLSELKIRRRQIDFAWGPASDHALRRTQFVEFVIAAGRDRGKGALCVARLTLTERGADPASWPEPQLASRGRQIDIDLGLTREFNGVALRWPSTALARDYDLLVSDDGQAWRTLRRVRGAAGALDALFLPESEARFLRLAPPGDGLTTPTHAGPGKAAKSSKQNSSAGARRRSGQARPSQLAGTRFGGTLPILTLKSSADWPTLNAVLATLAAELPRGDVPRAFLGEQNYWALVGVNGGGQRSGLISEDGAIEVGRGGFSVEPSVVLDDGTRVTWAGATLSASLPEGYLPLPAVRWQYSAFTLDIEAAADGPPSAPELLARYRLRNTGPRPQTYTLMLSLRPWQVNPPQQFLATQGGASTMRWLRWNGSELAVDTRAPLRFTQSPLRASGLNFDAGLGLAALQSAPALSVLGDAQAMASAALQWRVTLAPGAEQVWGWVAPLGLPAAAAGALTPARLDERFDAVATYWRERLNRSRVQVPPAAQRIPDTLRTSLAHILMSRDGPALQPGTRSYARSWVRDGAMMVAALVRLGEVEAAREFVDWFGQRIFASGKVPCCVDQRGADPVVENDSHGQYLYAVAELWRHTQDRALLQRHWPQVQRVTAWLEALRQSERSDANRRPERAHLFGLLPPSISHEGYSDKPAYSYWDDFWALRGFKDAAVIAQALGQEVEATRYAAWRDEFQAELQASIAATAERWHIDFIAGAADRGDFDATSTTMALNPAQAALPAKLLAATFERYWQQMNARSEGRRSWKDYTPYELRTVGALVRLGQSERAHAMLAFFFRDQRPPGWNQWAEVVLPKPREVRFLGDMPHAWVSSDYIRSVLDLFAYERELDGALVIGAGLQAEWLTRGVAVSGLSTWYGPLDFRLAPSAEGWQLTLGAGLRPPPGGLRLVWPGPGPLPKAAQGERPLEWNAQAELTLPPGPATVTLWRP